MNLKDKLQRLSKKEIIFSLSVIVFFSFFLLKTIEIAISLRFGISPDELEHIQIIKIFAESSFLPQITPETIVHGPLNKGPYLYYLLLGKFYNLDMHGLNNILVLRLLNVLFSSVTVLYIFKLAKLVSKSRYVQLLALILSTNLLMFTILSASISYDNLANMLAAMSIYYLIKYFKTYEIRHAYLYLIFILLGLLTKMTLIPLALITFMIMLSIFLKNLKKNSFKISQTVKKTEVFKLSNIFLIVLLGTLSFFVLNLYGKNLYTYKKLIPTCYQAASQELCQLNINVKRDKEILTDITDIQFVDPYNYFYVWRWHIFETTFGFFGHESLIKSGLSIIPYEIIITVALVGLIHRLKTNYKPLIFLLIISIFYIFILAYYQNYNTYRDTGLIQLALQGRYIFP
ncbi:glycosyltransferase family 39 protein, partial [Candidatus Dojkabacteria bacterium]|nr:glycosyltransferase family 39 protein [Candidatus Dojkabacteria bacterium]